MLKNEQQPLLTQTQAKRALRKRDKTFLVMVNQIETERPSTSNASHSAFLAQFSKCFMQDQPPGLPSS